MRVKALIDEDFVNYRLPSMFLASIGCDFKCCHEAGVDPTVCQNNPIASQPTIDIPAEEILRRYTSNPITKAVVFGGLEPMLQISDIEEILSLFRSNGITDDFVIYTGYNRHEVVKEVERLEQYENVIVKFGRYIPDAPSRYDHLLGVTLVSDNQYAVNISEQYNSWQLKWDDFKWYICRGDQRIAYVELDFCYAAEKICEEHNNEIAELREMLADKNQIS